MITETEIRTAKKIFEKIYKQYHHRKFTINDPIHWLYLYANETDKEIVGLISALCAFGNAKSFNNKIAQILSLWQNPSKGLMEWSQKDFISALKNFRHRFVDGKTIASFLLGVRKIIEEYGTIGALVNKHYKKCSGNLWHTLQSFTDELRELSASPLHFLVPHPHKGGACKRLWLYLRWMVRKDEIDVGCWKFLKPHQLIVPLDTHIYQWTVSLCLIPPRPLNARTTLLLTEIFRQINPDDPLRYDFSLCQAGMLGMRDKILYDEHKGK